MGKKKKTLEGKRNLFVKIEKKTLRQSFNLRQGQMEKFNRSIKKRSAK